jgi:hypothetical protein
LGSVAQLLRRGPREGPVRSKGPGRAGERGAWGELASWINVHSRDSKPGSTCSWPARTSGSATGPADPESPQSHLLRYWKR